MYYTVYTYIIAVSMGVSHKHTNKAWVGDQLNLLFLLLYHPFPSQALPIVCDKLVEEDKRSVPVEQKRRDVEGILRVILPCNHVLHVMFPIHMDNGEIKAVQAWRVQHSHHKTPCKGGAYIMYMHIITCTVHVHVRYICTCVIVTCLLLYL